MRGESQVAFAAFPCYVELGPQRRIADVAHQIQKSFSLCHRWSRKWNWTARAAAWDSAQWEKEAEAK
jgi:hypothetical protein